MKKPVFDTPKEYGKLFTNVEYWKPYIEVVLMRHDLLPVTDIRSATPGTHPVFIVNDRYVVKFYTDFFNGKYAFPIESAVYGLLTDQQVIPAPALITKGVLFPEETEWAWPYIVMPKVEGESIGEVFDSVSFENRANVAKFIGGILRDIHAVPVERSVTLSKSWDRFERFLAERRAVCGSKLEETGVVPQHLITQIDPYLATVPELIHKASQPYLLHSDLTRDHVLGSFEGDVWIPQWIIDFGDSKIGDRLYELGSLHIITFGCDKRLLRAFVDGYGADEEMLRNFVPRAMAFALLHEYEVLQQVFEDFPATRQMNSWDELASLMWDLDTPGLN